MKAYKVVLSPLAEADLEAIVDWIAINPASGRRADSSDASSIVSSRFGIFRFAERNATIFPWACEFWEWKSG